MANNLSKMTSYVANFHLSSYRGDMAESAATRVTVTTTVNIYFCCLYWLPIGWYCATIGCCYMLGIFTCVFFSLRELILLIPVSLFMTSELMCGVLEYHWYVCYVDEVIIWSVMWMK